MKKLGRHLSVIPILLIIACSEQLIEPVKSDEQTDSLEMTIDTSKNLSQAEITSLIFMREEEKLARDVYMNFHDFFDLKQFENIANSEQQHTDAIAYLLTSFHIDDPVQNDEAGVYNNDFFNTLYQDLVDRGRESSLEALKVGALIEEIDILDLRLAKDTLSHPSVIQVYDNLEKGSRNHLRSFYKSILKAGGSYQPQILSDDSFYEIINSDVERGNQ